MPLFGIAAAIFRLAYCKVRNNDLAEDQNRLESQSTVQMSEIAHNIRQILVVDDSLTIRMQVKELLETRGFAVLMAKNGRECLEVLESQKPDAILLDMIMPEMDGIEVCAILKSNIELREIPIIIHTTEGDIENKVKGLNAGADDYVTKDFEFEELIARLNVAIRNKKLRDELRIANRKILEQQKTIIKEERLKVLLKMAGATAYEMDHPLMTLLGHIELMVKNKNDPEKLLQYLEIMEDAGRQISGIVEKLRTLHFVDAKQRPGQTSCEIRDDGIVILTIEPSDDDFKMIASLLKNRTRINLIRCAGIREAMRALENIDFDIIFTDYVLPDGNGFDFLDLLERKHIEIPVVVITGQGDEMIASRVIQKGAYDYLPKAGVDEKTIYQTIAETLEKSALKKEIENARKMISEMSIQDELTGLYNRRYFMGALESEFSKAEIHETDLVLCMMDIDHFKHINDTFGHLGGDAVLAELGTRLRQNFRESDITSRYGGEEFAVILPDIKTNDAVIACERFRKAISAHCFQYDCERIRITVSIGMAFFDREKTGSHTELLEHADKMLYRAKETGRNKLCRMR